MTFIGRSLRKLRGPAWWVANIVQACLLMDLRDYADRKAQTPVKRFVYLVVLSIEALAKAVFVTFILLVLATAAVVALPLWMLIVDLGNLWRPR